MTQLATLTVTVPVSEEEYDMYKIGDAIMEAIYGAQQYGVFYDLITIHDAPEVKGG